MSDLPLRLELAPLGTVDRPQEREHSRCLTDDQWLALVALVDDERPRVYRLPREPGEPAWVAVWPEPRVTRIDADGSTQAFNFEWGEP